MDLPEIVFLHGMAGGHLERDGRRVWLSASGLLRGALGDELRGALSPAGHIRLFHRPAAYMWRRRGFTVHEFAYDWRQSLDECAAALASFLAGLAAPRVALVAHSMGGSVALRYAALFPDWRERVAAAVLIGVPVRGTFAAAEVLLGRFLLPRLAAAASGFRRRDTLDGIRRMAATMRGLIDLLPDPESFPTAAILYHAATWPEDCRPRQELLDASLRLKREMPASPLFDRAVTIAARAWPTPAGIRVRDGGSLAVGPETAPGDGVTLLAAALPASGPAFEARLPHAFQLWEPAVVRAAAAVARGEAPDLPRFQAE